MTPDFRIDADGKDATAAMADRLLSIEVTDEIDDKSDRLVVTLDNRDGQIDLPSMDAKLTVWLGYRLAPLSLMGVYSVDALSGEGPMRTLTISATAADMKGEIRAPRTVAWQDVSLADIVGTIAERAGLTAMIGDAISRIRWPYLAQTAESDLHFLTRIARQIDAIAKPAGGHLVVQPRASETTASGDAVPVVAPAEGDISHWSWEIDSRNVDGSVEAVWIDPDSASRNVYRAGSDDPVTRMRQSYASEEEARRAAEGRLRGGRNGGLTVTVEMSKLMPDAVAGGRLTLPALDPWLSGDWEISRATHRLESGLRTTIEARRDPPK